MSSVTTRTLLEMKEKGARIVALTCYDALFARLLDASGVDILLVGDSLNQVLAGAPSTLSATLDQMIYHTKMVRRGTERAMVVCDMPFLSYQISQEDALRNCGRAMKETGCNAVKVEGGQPMAATVRRLVDIGIPVMGHLGLTPQSVHALGGYRVQGREDAEAGRLKADATALQDAGGPLPRTGAFLWKVILNCGDRLGGTDGMSKTEDEKLAKLIKKNMAKAAKAKPKARKRYDPTLPPDSTDDDIERRDFFSEMKKREF